jgi:hypothetical protein
MNNVVKYCEYSKNFGKNHVCLSKLALNYGKSFKNAEYIGRSTKSFDTKVLFSPVRALNIVQHIRGVRNALLSRQPGHCQTDVRRFPYECTGYRPARTPCTSLEHTTFTLVLLYCIRTHRHTKLSCKCRCPRAMKWLTRFALTFKYPLQWLIGFRYRDHDCNGQALRSASQTAGIRFPTG